MTRLCCAGKKADLHVHTYYSDGVSGPCEVVAEAKRNGVGILSVTDHDTDRAYKEINDCCAGAGIFCVRGIEVSAYIGDVKFHMLGYNADCENSGFKAFLKFLYEGSVSRAEDVIFKLNASGVCLSLEEALAERKEDCAPLHSMYIARAGAKKGYAQSPFSFYKKFLMPGYAGYSRVARPSPEQTAEIISGAGGLVSLAHPGRIDMCAADLKQTVKSLKACGLGGIEAVYSTHTVNETAYYKELAKQFGLYVTGGSDTHGRGGKRRIGSPEFIPTEELCERLGLC